MPTKASSPSETGASRPVACLNCRQRRSYCSKDKPACARCRDAGLSCVYEGARKILINESYLRELERKANVLKKNVCHVVPSSANAETGTTSQPEEEDDDFDDNEPLFEPFTPLCLNRPSMSFQGPASSDTFLRNVRKATGLGDQYEGLDIDPNLCEPDKLPSKKRVFSQQLRLPPLQVARRFFITQYSFIGPIFAFTESKEEFEKSLSKAYHKLPDPTDVDACLEYAKLLLILAFGQMYSVNQWVDFRGPPGIAYFSEALGLLPETHEGGSLLCVECLALAGYFLQNMNRRDAAFQFIGRAMRMAISLGLHHDLEKSSRTANSSPPVMLIDEAAKERRRRTWWSVYSLDRIVSVKSGNPITIQDEDIGIGLPSRLPSEPEYCPAIVLRQYTKLSRILGEIHKRIYHRTNKAETKSGKALMASVQRIVIDLSNWDRELPDGLRFDPDRLSGGRESVSTLAHYYQCINMTIRPLLFHVVKRRLALIRQNSAAAIKETDWKVGLSQTTVKVIDMCIGAALDNINIMAIAASKDLVATYGYMDGEHIFSSTIVLVMVCAAFPTSSVNMSAMNCGMGLLRGMAERGNTHIGARYEVLIRLLSTVMPGDDSVPFDSMPSDSSLSSALALPPAQQSASSATASLAEPGGAILGNSSDPPRFPVIDMQTLLEPFYDESASTGMDFHLWEEGFAYPTMDLDLDLAQQQPPRGLTSNADYQH